MPRADSRDSSWLWSSRATALEKLAARFVSGKLIQLKPDLDLHDGPRERSLDFTDLQLGPRFICRRSRAGSGLDPTLGALDRRNHIPLAATPHSRTQRQTPAWRARKVVFEFDMKVDGSASTRHHHAVLGTNSWCALSRS
jgi:hypothetical protein